ncbi:uncharacterized protein N7529_009669 [Penicillium soppii]|uniref:uncharacterized protein n=1 Tax=Penicillium soppii TaxID=69789 RepID=UPI002547512B|nr:uncharacterized protein N7529_009669 [Penicillium soppii]KAJ5855725.1 hypothetical protein N7529_009669 [Penicillium soppii]
MKHQHPRRPHHPRRRHYLLDPDPDRDRDREHDLHSDHDLHHVHDPGLLPTMTVYGPEMTVESASEIAGCLVSFGHLEGAPDAVHEVDPV